MSASSPPLTPGLSHRSSRRSFPNLTHLSLAPLSSRFPIDSSEYDEEQWLATSYIEPKTAPTTPGVLSRSSSRRRKPRTTEYAYDGHIPVSDSGVLDFGGIRESKSTSALPPVTGPYGISTKRGVTKNGVSLRRPRAKQHHTEEGNDEWFHRAGLAIASETRDSKGQGWLVHKSNSTTSLVHVGNGYDEHPSHEPGHLVMLSGEHYDRSGGEEFPSPVTPRYSSRYGSRAGSRIHSARQSRRGSRVGSRVELMMAGDRTPTNTSGIPVSALEADGYFGQEVLAEPDFVEPDKEGLEDEEEITRLAREQRMGFGGWFDRLIGWSLFKVDEDGEETETDGESAAEQETEEQVRKRRVEEARKRWELREQISASTTRNPGAERPPREGEGGWQDAAWLLSVASKVLL